MNEQSFDFLVFGGGGNSSDFIKLFLFRKSDKALINALYSRIVYHHAECNGKWKYNVMYKILPLI
jgi:hypothetical protein